MPFYSHITGHWIKNYDHLSQFYNIYACDLVGFGRSSRPEFLCETPEGIFATIILLTTLFIEKKIIEIEKIILIYLEAEEYFLKYFDAWIKGNTNLKIFIFVKLHFKKIIYNAFTVTSYEFILKKESKRHAHDE